MAAYYVISDGIGPKLKLIHTLMYVTHKDEENQMKNEGNRVVKSLYSYILDAQGQLTLVTGGWMWLKIKLIQTFMSVLVTRKNEEDPSKNEGARVVTTDHSL